MLKCRCPVVQALGQAPGQSRAAAPHSAARSGPWLRLCFGQSSSRTWLVLQSGGLHTFQLGRGQCSGRCLATMQSLPVKLAWKHVPLSGSINVERRQDGLPPEHLQCMDHATTAAAGHMATRSDSSACQILLTARSSSVVGAGF